MKFSALLLSVLPLFAFASEETLIIDGKEVNREALNGCILKKLILGVGPFDDDDDGKGKRRQLRGAEEERDLKFGCILAAIGFEPGRREMTEEVALPEMDREVLNGCILKKLILGVGPFDDEDDDDGKGKRRASEDERDLKFGCILAALGFSPTRRELSEEVALPTMDREVLNGCILKKLILGVGPFDDEDDDGKGKRRATEEDERDLKFGCILAALGFSPTRRELTEEVALPTIDREVLNGCILKKLILGEGPFDEDDEDGKGKRRVTEEDERDLKFGCILAALGFAPEY